MATAVIHADDNGVTASLSITDKKGNITAPAFAPVWSLSADGVVSMTVADDGLSASFTPITVGEVTVDVVVEGDPTPGVDTIHGTGTISVLAAEAASVELVFGSVS